MDGAYYISINPDGIPPLVISIKSLLETNPGLPVAVATDCPGSLRQKLPANAPVQIITVPHRVKHPQIESLPEYPHQGFFGKVYHFYKSPFDYTLFLDFDTLVLGDIREIFGLMRSGHFDMAMAHDVGRSSSCPYGVEIPLAARMFNTGVVAYHKCQTVENTMAAWWENILALNDPWGDQPAFLKAVHDNSFLRFLTLPCEWNLRFIYPQAPFGPVKILHGRPSAEADLATIGKRVNRVTEANRFWFGAHMYGYYNLLDGTLKDA